MSILQSAFASNPALLARVRHASSDPTLAALLEDIAQHILELHGKVDITANGHTIEPSSKKRKHGDMSQVATSITHGNTAPAANATSWMETPPVFVAQDISIAVPLRKKLRIEISSNGKGDGGFVGISASGDKEIAMAWREVEQVLSVPVPEKAQPAHYFVIIPTAHPMSSTTREPIVLTVPGGAAKGVTFPGGTVNVQEGETQEALFRRIINQQLARSSKSVVVPDEKEFVSAMVQAHRKGEKGWHVKAWRGSKEGFLYFLPTGILFGFRKPLLYFPFHSVSSISYSSILQRTFNLNITASTPETNSGKGSEEEIEFAMLDQADFAGIDAYIKRHRLNDASLAEARRAKVYNVNKPTDKEPDGAVPEDAHGDRINGYAKGEYDEDPLTRQEKALQDQEDEEEEDYDPSGGSSEGSGEDTDDEEAQGDDGGGDEEEEIEDEAGGYEDEVEEDI